MPKKLFLLDALALIYRAYFALSRNPRMTSYGKNTNAQFGFTTTLLDLIKKEKPTHMAVAFDTHAPTERHTDFTDYKANREAAPEDLIAALPDIKRIIEGFDIPVLELDGYEADDIIGTVAKEAATKGYEVYMVTPDKDYGQLVSDKIFMYRPPAFGEDARIYGPKEICEKWSINTVDQVIDMLGLMGDAVDNIPGIKGVGEKTAAKLLAEYGTLENVLDNAENIKGAVGKKVMEGKESAILSKKLATIITNVPIEFNEEAVHLGSMKEELLKPIFEELEFRTLGKRLFGAEIGEAPQRAVVQTSLFGDDTLVSKPTPTTDGELDLMQLKTIADTKPNYKLLETEKEFFEFIKKASSKKEICFDTETTGTDANQAELVGLSFCFTKGEAFYAPCSSNREEVIELLEKFDPLFSNPNITWIGHNIKYDMLMLSWYGVSLAGPVYDTMLAHYLVEPEGKRSMDVLSEKFLGYQPISIETLIGEKVRGKSQGSMRDAEIDKIKDYAAEDADITFQLKQVLQPMVLQEKVNDVLTNIENKLVPVLVAMEKEGIAIDVQFLENYSKELGREAAAAEANVMKQAGVKFNLASPKQLGEVLFDKLQLDASAKKTKTGQYATGEDVLLKLAKKHQIVDDILAFREYTKLQNTYVDALPLLINSKTNRVHTSYNQAVAVTGRLSSNNPNLQNIPIRTDRGKEIRKAFIPRSDKHILLSADYSQIELRIVAAISGDEKMCEAFKRHKDIHNSTAAYVFGVAENEVTKEMRYKAKSVNFGIIYGQGAFGLAENLAISRTEAKGIIDNYFAQYKFLKQYMDDTIQFARDNGYVQTLVGRKRWLRDINSSNATVRAFAERNAINSPVQGTAADMIKLAMIKIEKAMREAGMQSKMILQVHDELVFDTLHNEKEDLKKLILSNMETALELPYGVPVIAEVGEGKNWLEAH
jgi:DNA polymerase I